MTGHGRSQKSGIMKKKPVDRIGPDKTDWLSRDRENASGRFTDLHVSEEACRHLITVLRENDAKKFKKELKRTLTTLRHLGGLQAASHFIRRIELDSGMRKPTLALYDNCLHFIGGGQKYGLTMADALKDRFGITILANKPVTHRQIFDWYQLDLAGCPIKIIPLPFYERLGSAHLDPARVTKKMENPFHLVSRESAGYDFFVNNCMLEMVYPLSAVSVMMVHFPERRPVSYFYPPCYTRIMYNSRYTAAWIQKKWKIAPHRHIYPPVDMAANDANNAKRNLILSVARFEEGGTKKQMEMVRSFLSLRRTAGELSSGWRFILAGGSNPANPYLESVKKLVLEKGNGEVELRINTTAEELKSLYREARIFWHLCGLGQRDPAKIEHFGMTICEAMQNSLVPLVFDGGGQREIVDHGLNGFRVNSTVQLNHHTLELMRNPGKLKALGKQAREKSKQYSRERFIGEIQRFFDELLDSFLCRRADET